MVPIDCCTCEQRGYLKKKKQNVTNQIVSPASLATDGCDTSKRLNLQCHLIRSRLIFQDIQGFQ